MVTAEDDAISTRLLQQLSQTPYACSSLSPPLSSRDANVVYRGILAQPLHAQDGATAKSIIIKHAVDGESKIFEEVLLQTLINFSPSMPTDTITIKTPRLYLSDRDSNTQILEDFSNSNNFRAILFNLNAHDVPSSPSTASIGYHLGFWLRSFHNWTSAPEQAALRAQTWQNDHMRKTKFLLTYDIIFKVIENYPELAAGYEETLEAFRDVMVKDSQMPSTNKSEGYGIVHGDFWSGNILVGRGNSASELFIIDWEFAHFGHQSTDLGQIIGDIYERIVYNDLDHAISTMEGVIDGYGAISVEMALRTAMYVGVHLISYYNRRPLRAPKAVSPEVIMAGLTVGRDFIVKGWQKDVAFFRDSALASLFAVR